MNKLAMKIGRLIRGWLPFAVVGDGTGSWFANQLSWDSITAANGAGKGLIIVRDGVYGAQVLSKSYCIIIGGPNAWFKSGAGAYTLLLNSGVSKIAVIGLKLSGVQGDMHHTVYEAGSNGHVLWLFTEFAEYGGSALQFDSGCYSNYIIGCRFNGPGNAWSINFYTTGAHKVIGNHLSSSCGGGVYICQGDHSIIVANYCDVSRRL